MTPAILVERLTDFIRENTGDLILQCRVPGDGEGHKERPPLVYAYGLPEKRDTVQRIPYVLVRPVKGNGLESEDDPLGSEAWIRIIAVTYSADVGQGAMDALNLVTKICNALVAAQYLGGQFALREVPEWALYDDEEDAHYHFGELMTRWRLPPSPGIPNYSGLGPQGFPWHPLPEQPPPEPDGEGEQE